MRWELLGLLMSSKQRASPIGKNSRFVNYSPKKAKDPQCNGDMFVVSGKAATYMDEKQANFGQDNGKEMFVCNPSLEPKGGRNLNQLSEEACMPWSFGNGLKYAAALAHSVQSVRFCNKRFGLCAGGRAGSSGSI